MKLCSACNKSFADTETFCPHDGEVLQQSPEDFVGRLIDGKYKVEGFIAQGGMGAVYRARHILLGDMVVIKTLRSEMRNNAEWLKRFQREGKAARSFRHPNSVTVYDLSAGSDGMIYMVMEYVEGHTLDKELKRRGRFTPAEALDVLEPVADVLDSAHARGVVHRDLKPENIMLGSDDRGNTVVKVLDLGIAKIVGAGDVHAAGATSLTVAGQILGTPYYMSPEQWGEMPRDGDPEVDGRTDIYSLGVIFFELIAGKKPLGGKTLAELRQKHVAAVLPSLSEVVSGVPEAFGRGVMRAMAKDRADRPQTPGAFIDELRVALGLTPHNRKPNIHSTETGAAHATDAGLRGTSAQGRGTGMSEAATAHLSAGTNAEAFDQSHANTILTSEFESPSTSGGGRETSAQSSQPATSGNVAARREGGRETIASHAAETVTGAGLDAQQRTYEESSPAFRQDAAQHAAAGHGAGVSVTAPEPRRSVAPLVAGGTLALLLVAGVGGWFVWKGTRAAKPDAPSTPTVNGSVPAKLAEAPKVEAASYWYEAFDKKDDASGKHVADAAATLESGKWFKFHFMPRERGYLYIIGPYKDGNAQVTMLTAEGAGALKSNLVGAGADFSFPFGGTKLHLDENAGADDFTFIFSPTPLMSPSFLAGKFLHELTPAEVKELEDFRAQARSGASEASAKGEGGDARVAVLAPEAATSGGKPLIFDVRVNHK
ncbi:MAG: eukaryotic-like serine/threonine-protein kinase [Acidobacteriota bacterium]|jgi:serine/threonine-protein kinase|nr:eukaryotic-like serine/threonine-protein kinase [Acidobacteriota bacterium]MDT7777508.1 eukaryotic-like serine/threonine-protein kinase [Acidobacteriota bacterium]